MSRDANGAADFERQLHSLLEESVQRVGGRARSRLNQARQAAVAEAARRSHWHLPLHAVERFRSGLLWMPATGAVAAAVLAVFVLWPHAPQGYPAAEANQTSVEDLDLLADRDGIDMVQGGGDDQFYEWAMAQPDQGGRPADGSAPGPGKAHGAPSTGTGTNQNSG